MLLSMGMMHFLLCSLFVLETAVFQIEIITRIEYWTNFRPTQQVERSLPIMTLMREETC